MRRLGLRGTLVAFALLVGAQGLPLPAAADGEKDAKQVEKQQERTEREASKEQARSEREASKEQHARAERESRVGTGRRDFATGGPDRSDVGAEAPAEESAPASRQPGGPPVVPGTQPKRTTSTPSRGHGRPKKRSHTRPVRAERRAPALRRAARQDVLGIRRASTGNAQRSLPRDLIITAAGASAVASAPRSGRRARRPGVTVAAIAPPSPLPARIFPEPVRDIVEVVPGELWGALAGLALLAVALGIWSGFTTIRSRRLARQRHTLLQEVGLLQAALLPPVPEEIPVSVAYRPAEGVAAGGDFYEAFALHNGAIGLIIGDVSGHGRDALARTTLVRYTLRAHLEAGLEPREVIKVAGGALADQLGAGFATASVAVYDPESARLSYASGGHHPPLIVGPGSHEPVTVCSAPPLGIGEPTGFRQTTLTLTAGSTALLYTDGLSEARVGEGMLGRDRLAELLEALPADAGCEALLARVSAVASDLPDDMAACVVRAPVGAPEAGTRIEELEVGPSDIGESLEHFLRVCGVPLPDVPGVLREAGEAARREGAATVRVRLGDFRPGVDVIASNLVQIDARRRAGTR